MTIALLDPARAAKLKRAPLTYSRDVISGQLPAGYRVLRRERVLAGVDLAIAAHGLMHWFVLHRADDGTITFTVSAVSRPARLLSRLGGPLTRRVQLDMVERYLRAAARPAGECGRTDA